MSPEAEERRRLYPQQMESADEARKSLRASLAKMYEIRHPLNGDMWQIVIIKIREADFWLREFIEG